MVPLACPRLRYCKECYDYPDHMRKLVREKHEKEANPNSEKAKGADAMAKYWFDRAQCVATDDPRIAGKKPPRADIQHSVPSAAAAPALPCSPDTPMAKAAAETARALRPTRGLAQGQSQERPRFERRTRWLRKRLSAGCKIVWPLDRRQAGRRAQALHSRRNAKRGAEKGSG